jgi:deoxycytidine triphosphate deaminase
MLLSKDEIEKKALVSGAAQSGYENASYDVRVGCIITPEGKEVDVFSLPPQGIVRVIATEIVSLPADVSGFALVKTSLCNEGVLALNIGIIDPLYSGPVTSALINFGKEARIVHRNQVFLRLTFFSYDPANRPSDKARVSQEEAKAENRRLSLQFFGGTFLDIENTTKRVASRAFESYRKAFLIYVPLAAIFLAGLTFLLNFSSLALMQKFVQPVDSAKVLHLQETVDHQKIELDELKHENQILRDTLNGMLTKPTAPRTP